MQELITEIAIYLAIAALLGLILGYLFWGMGSRRRMEAARAEAATDVRTSVDGGSSLRIQVDELTQERDRLLHRVEVLSIRVASLMETAGGTESAEDVAEKMGMVRLDVSDNPGDRLDEAARSFPEPGDAAEPSMDDVSIFDEQDQPDGRDPDTSDGYVIDADENVEPAQTASGDGDDTLTAPEDPNEEPEAAAGLFERWDVEPPLRIRKDPADDGVTPDTTANTEADADDMPPVPLRPRRPTAPEDEDIPPLRRRPLFAAAQALKPDTQPEPSSDEAVLPDPADATAGPDQDEPRQNVADVPDEPDTAGSSPEPKPDNVAVAEDETTETAATSTENEEQVPEAPDLEGAGDPDNADDLTRIKGIGKSTAKSLNALGIWQFDQIAGLDPGGLDWLRGKLSAQMGRSIDKWPDQARSLTGSDDT